MTFLKPAITCLLALIFQLAQVLPVASASASPCETVARCCGCCEGGTACDCVKEDAPAPSQPAAPDTEGGVKIPSLNPAETNIPLVSLREVVPAGPVRATPQWVLPVGYPGVRLAVAFCSFVI